jgi:DNA-binding MarR family transcriptional regulator
MTKHDIVDEVVDGCLMARARQLARVVTAIYDDELRDFEIKPSQLSLLVVVAKAGPIRRIDIGRTADLDPSTLTRNLSVMLANGWIKEVVEGDDRRGNPVSITPKGKNLIERVAPAWRKAQQRARKLLGNDRAEALLRMFSVPGGMG